MGDDDEGAIRVPHHPVLVDDLDRDVSTVAATASAIRAPVIRFISNPREW
ncbi:hypothetical protein [Saccharopolyspora cebuensis]|uniref:Uncharacterized protein n=1 Tax=Saccharopolyspora cebuensis TaxID=418759 RepID=A0ABV4CG60_9PSEU